MKALPRLGLAALGVCLFAARDAQAYEMIPVKVNFVFRFDVAPNHQPKPSYPWWMYFPHDPHLMQPASGPMYPNWPTPQQMQQQQQQRTMSAPRAPYAAPPPGTPNIVWNQGVPMVLPASYQPAPGYWFAR